MSYSVGQVSRIARVTVRALHHYDEIGLLRPSTRTDAGYRDYSGDDLERLQRILLYRELGFPLDQIAVILDDTTPDPLDHLRRQHTALTDRIARLQRMAATMEEMMNARRLGINLEPQQLFEVFGDADPTRYADETEERWGDTDAYKESHRRTSTYMKEDWLQLKAEGAEIQQRFAAVYREGVPAGSPGAIAVAEEHRRHLNRWFYDCSYAMHRGLGDMFVSDPRFAATYDALATGLAQYVRDAMHANADAQVPPHSSM